MTTEYMTEDEFNTLEEAVQIKTNAIMYMLARSVQAGQRDVTMEEIRRANPTWTEPEVAASFVIYQQMLALSPDDVALTVRVCRKRLNDLGLEPEDEWRH